LLQAVTLQLLPLDGAAPTSARSQEPAWARYPRRPIPQRKPSKIRLLKGKSRRIAALHFNMGGLGGRRRIISIFAKNRPCHPFEALRIDAVSPILDL
jgi:hypothetical protein